MRGIKMIPQSEGSSKLARLRLRRNLISEKKLTAITELRKKPFT